jgi:hypothetical protein
VRGSLRSNGSGAGTRTGDCADDAGFEVPAMHMPSRRREQPRNRLIATPQCVYLRAINEARL